MHRISGKHLLIAMTFIVGGLFGVLLPSTAHAQTSDPLGVAHSFVIEGESITNGSVVSHQDNTYRLSTEAYDKSTFGVVTQEPAIQFTTTNPAGTHPVVRSGTVSVRVTASNGTIKPGDLIATSGQPGIAMKATKSGFTLGIARGTFAPNSPDEVGLVPVALDIKFTFAADSPNSEKISARLLDVVNLSTLAALEEPSQVFRRVVAAAAILVPIALSIFTIVRSAQKGVVALGRNPLAKTAILGGMVFNSMLSLLFVAAGIVGAVVILTV